MVVASQALGEEAKGSCRWMGTEFPFYETQKVLELCFTTMQLFSTLLSCILKTVSVVGFTMCVFFNTHKAKKKKKKNCLCRSGTR